MGILKGIPALNVQALLALLCFGLCLFFARVIRLISEGKLPGGSSAVLYLRIIVGFLFAAAITFGLASFFGKYILTGGL